MKKLTILILLISCFSGRGGQMVFTDYMDRFPSILPRIELEIRKSKILSSIIQHESRGNEKAINRGEDAVGILQIRKIYVDECNRISGKRFSYSDRWSAEKSIEMFHIIMDYYAPDYDVDKVCMMHNAGKISHRSMRITKQYRADVMKIYNQLSV